MKMWPLEPSVSDSIPVAIGSRERNPHLFPGVVWRTAPSSRNQRRDIVLWDLGGQEEYRLIHQLFLHDTTVALGYLILRAALPPSRKWRLGINHWKNNCGAVAR